MGQEAASGIAEGGRREPYTGNAGASSGETTGICPNCSKIIPLDAVECPHCPAVFGPESAWKVLPHVVSPSHIVSPRGAEARYPVQFTATAAEYFRIWIVNLALTILTLGIYSAWAKVRKRRYFYSHTRIDGDPFEYRGNPLAILKGRLIALVVFVAVYSTWNFAPSYIGPLIIAVIAIVPWLIVRSLAFNARNSVFRNTSFQFSGTYLRCLGLLLWNGLLVVLTFGLGYPYLKSRFIQFMAGNHCYGTTQFSVPELKPLYFRIYSWAIGVALVAGFAVAVLFIGIGAIAGAVVYGGDPVAAKALTVQLTTVGGYLTWLVVFAYLRARLANATFNNLIVGPVRFECDLRATGMLGLYLVNIMAILLTLGLATPWAAVRTMRYRTQRMTVIAAGGLDGFVAAETATVTAAGEEVTELFDFDISI